MWLKKHNFQRQLSLPSSASRLTAGAARAVPLVQRLDLLFNINMKDVQQKRKRGRPATGHTPVVALRLAADEIRLVDELAAELRVDRSKALRELLRHGLAAYNRKKKRVEGARRKVEAAAVAANAAIVDDVLDEQAWRERLAVAAPKQQAGPRRLTPDEIRAAADRAEQRSRSR
jgi:hypothetical protein